MKKGRKKKKKGRKEDRRKRERNITAHDNRDDWPLLSKKIK